MFWVRRRQCSSLTIVLFRESMVFTEGNKLDGISHIKEKL